MAPTGRPTAATRWPAPPGWPCSRRSATRTSSANAAARGAELVAGLGKIAAEDDRIGDIRGRGLMVGVEFVRDRATREPDSSLPDRLMAACADDGLLVLTCGHSHQVVRWIPPLNVTGGRDLRGRRDLRRDAGDDPARLTGRQPRARSLRAAASAILAIRARRVSGRRASATQPRSILRADGGKAAKWPAAGGWRSSAARRSSGTSSRSDAVERLPRPVRLGTLDRGQTRRRHQAIGDQPLDPRLVGRGPHAARLARSEVELAPLVVEVAAGAVDPSEAEGFLDGRLVFQADPAGSRTPGHQPGSTSGGVVGLEPGAPGGPVVGVDEGCVVERGHRTSLVLGPPARDRLRMSRRHSRSARPPKGRALNAVGHGHRPVAPAVRFSGSGSGTS